MRYVVIIIILALGVFIIANPFDESTTPETITIFKTRYDPGTEGIEVFIEGYSEKWRPVIPTDSYNTEAEFRQLVITRVKDYHKPVVPVIIPEPTDKINEAKKIIGKEIGI